MTLVAAMQLLMFAPNKWEPSRPFSKSPDDYDHRFPTPDDAGCIELYTDRFSLEDLLRACDAINLATDRRMKDQARVWAKREPVHRFRKTTEYTGYVDFWPRADLALEAMKGQGYEDFDFADIDERSPLDRNETSV